VSDAPRVGALLSDAYGYSGQLDEARGAAYRAQQMLTSHSTPLARISTLIAAGHWPPTPAEGETSLRKAIALAQQTGFRLAEFDARRLLLERSARIWRKDEQQQFPALAWEMR
jgi:hypothetical protein